MDDYRVHCIVCGSCAELEMYAHRVDGKMVGWIFACQRHRSEVRNMDLKADQQAGIDDLLAQNKALKDMLRELYEEADEAVGCVDLNEMLSDDLNDRLAALLKEE